MQCKAQQTYSLRNWNIAVYTSSKSDHVRRSYSWKLLFPTK